MYALLWPAHFHHPRGFLLGLPFTIISCLMEELVLFLLMWIHFPCSVELHINGVIQSIFVYVSGFFLYNVLRLILGSISSWFLTAKQYSSCLFSSLFIHSPWTFGYEVLAC